MEQSPKAKGNQYKSGPYHAKKQSQFDSMKLAPIFEGKDGEKQRYQSLDGTQAMNEINKQEYASSTNMPSFKGELVNIDIPKIVTKKALAKNASSLNQSRSIADMQLLASTSLNGKTTTASDLTSNMTHHLKKKFKQKYLTNRKDVSASLSAATIKKQIPQVPAWKRDKSSVSQQDLEIFSQILQDGETILHKKNDDPYNLLNDKNV